MHVLALEPYAALSHQRFLDGLARHSAHAITAETLPARNWKWRMRTASLHFAARLREREPPGLLLASDYVNLAELLALLPPAWRDVPALVYLHENQLTYPLQGDERRDVHFALTHLHALLAAREAWFNSAYHRDAFRAALRELLARAPDVDLAWIEAELDRRCRVEPLGIEVPAHAPRGAVEAPVVLWNHRLEYDKGPDRLLEAARTLLRSGEPFRLRVVGPRFREEPAELGWLRTELDGALEELGFVEDRTDYERALRSSDVVLSTARHEFFGVAVAEALRSGCLPVLPDDLAYPELLPPDVTRERFLYRADDPEAAGEALVRAVQAVREGAWTADRRRIAAFAARFDWDARIAGFDAGFERIAGTPGLRRA